MASNESSNTREEKKTVVVTGASSGIGRATVLMLADKGWNVAFCARRHDALASLNEEVLARGGSPYFKAFDITDEAQVYDFANSVASHFGGIDVWVNNASVYILGNFGDIPTSAFRRAMEINFFGSLYGAKAVYPHFRFQQGGILINVDSLDGKVGVPYASAYVATKFALRGFAEALRAELAQYNIEVCTVLPAVTDTPLFLHSANYFGKKMVAMPPVSPPEVVAEAIVGLIEKPQKEVTVGKASGIMSVAHNIAPDTMTKAMTTMVAEMHFEDEPAAFTAGNMYEPVDTLHSASGGWREEQAETVAQV